jgi:predicted nucleic acid-binding protein
MPTKLSLYLDTSVVSAYVDERDPGRQELTRQFWERLTDYDGAVSPIVLDEIQSTAEVARREQMLGLVHPLRVVPWEPEMDRLARHYVARAAFTPALLQDARHVAACTVAGIPVLVSWNFRHLVNRTRRIRVNLVNSEQGYAQIEILAPPEVL